MADKWNFDIIGLHTFSPPPCGLYLPLPICAKVRFPPIASQSIPSIVPIAYEESGTRLATIGSCLLWKKIWDVGRNMAVWDIICKAGRRDTNVVEYRWNMPSGMMSFEH